MKLLDRYLSTVKTCLPRAQQEDIIRELSENILSQIEDKETELGRALNEAEQEAIISQHGDPMLVASRYRVDHGSLALGRQLVGPELFPLYLKLLRINLGLTLVACVIIAVALKSPFSSSINAILFHLFLQFGILTLVFALADAGQRKLRTQII